MRETFDNLMDWIGHAIKSGPAADGIDGDVAITEAELQADLSFGRDIEVETPEKLEEPELH